MRAEAEALGRIAYTLDDREVTFKEAVMKHAERAGRSGPHPVPQPGVGPLAAFRIGKAGADVGAGTPVALVGTGAAIEHVVATAPCEPATGQTPPPS